MSIIERIAQTDYVRSAIEDKADLSAFHAKPSSRTIIGIAVIALSYLIGWPAIGVVGALSVYLKKPILIAIGGPLLYGLSHLLFLFGMYLAGARYTRIFMRWATRVTVEKLLSKRS